MFLTHPPSTSCPSALPLTPPSDPFCVARVVSAPARDQPWTLFLFATRTTILFLLSLPSDLPDPPHPSKPFTSEFPRADIHDIIAPDILHQVIKGTFKDHLVTWVEDFLVMTHGKNNAKVILDDIDRR
jgi:hypothetical protein